jgi:hypothetical protein
VFSVCGAQDPASIDAALAMLDRALDALNAADLASAPAAVQAQALRALQRAEAKHTAARARTLAAFTAQSGYEDDGHGSARVWLKWQTQITSGAAAGAVAWMRRLAAHPVIARALAAGTISPSWAREFCAWTDRLPGDRRDDADEILASVAASGAELADLAGLAAEMYERCRAAGPGEDDGDRFDDRGLWLDLTFRGAGRLNGNLTAACAAALSAVLDKLGKRAGPEDTRTAAQRRHDALEEACRRLLADGMLPGRTSRQLMVHITLAQLRGMPGASSAEAAWRAAAAREHGWLAGPAADAAACDATVVPIVTGCPDSAALDRLVDVFLAGHGIPSGGGPPSGAVATGEPSVGASPVGGLATGGPSAGAPPVGGLATGGPSFCRLPVDGSSAGGSSADGSSAGGSWAGGSSAGETAAYGCTGGVRACADQARACPSHAYPSHACPSHACVSSACIGRAALSPQTRQRLAGALLAMAADAVSGPGGLAAWLRARLGAAPLTSASLPLDVGAATETIPAHLRRAATARHPHCAFPGCDEPASVCDIHHLVPRAEGGATALSNLVPLCGFHHLIVIHRWGWTLTLHPDGTTTATSRDGRVLHSHSPPGRAA